MTQDIDDALAALLLDVLEHRDTGFVRVPVELLSIKAAAAQYGVSERTMRRRCEQLGIGIKDGKTWLVPVQVLPALPANDTGMIDDVQHDVVMIRELTSWPTSLSTAEGAQIIPVVWGERGPKESKMQTGFAPTQRFSESLKLRLPAGMGATLQFAARRRAQSTSDWIRQALLDRLHREGLVLTDTGVTHRPQDF